VRVALVGQPNCGKSTILNAVAGYRAETANFPGSTVQVATGQVRMNGFVAELVDLPGIYSLTTSNPAESASRSYLLFSDIDLIINVIDASLLCRSLELTLELRELGRPMIVCLNMLDEAERKGVAIDTDKLSRAISLPVVSTVAARGEGLDELFRIARGALGKVPDSAGDELCWDKDVEVALSRIESVLNQDCERSLPPRFVAVKLLEDGNQIDLGKLSSEVREQALEIRRSLEQTRGRAAEAVIMSERHDLTMRLFEKTAKVGHPHKDFRTKVDSLLTHPFWGYVLLVAGFVGFFWAVFGVGSKLENVLQTLLAGAYTHLFGGLVAGSFWEVTIRSLWGGFVGGAAIVLPYLVPFLFGLAFLEDVGYLPRVAYLMDGLLHRIGLHGTSTLPLILGYGCSVPACMATRILPSRRDRFLASVLAVMVPCSARSNIIFAMVAFYLGPMWALAIFGINLLVVIFSGWLLTRIWPEISPGMILEVPRYQWPHLGVMLRKVWLRLREFIMLSWPLLVVGSVILGFAEYLGWDRAINFGLSPLTRLLGLPVVVGTTLVFGLLRKELTIIMLVQALGTTNVAHAMTAVQILTYTLFITFYIPCLATMAALAKEIGKKLTAAAVAYTFVLSIAVGVTARFVLGYILN
jgi:ferrous iron transport protein B